MLQELREGSRSHSAVEQSLRGVLILEDFVRQRGIDFEARTAEGTFLSKDEILGLIRSIGGTRGRVPGALRRPTTRRKRVTGRRSARTGVRPMGANTRATRIGALLRYLCWLIETFGSRAWAGLPARAATEMQRKADRFIARVKARKPRTGAVRSRISLVPAQREVLYAALHATVEAAEASGLEERQFVADRTMLWFDYAIEFGLRTGEMLGLRLRDFDLAAGSFEVVRRPDAPDDPRRDLARVKGEGRGLDLSPYLAARTREHVDQQRSRRPGAARHDFLFVASAGAPLSRSSVTLMFQRLRAAYPALGKGFCSHTNRHNWNDDFSASAKQMGLSEDKEASDRAYSMGWTSVATARFYLVRRTRERVAEINLRSQQRHMAARGVARG